MKPHSIRAALSCLILMPPFLALGQQVIARGREALPLPGEVFEVDGRTAFVILSAAENLHPNRPTPWVWYAPTLSGLPEAREQWMFENAGTLRTSSPAHRQIRAAAPESNFLSAPWQADQTCSLERLLGGATIV